jgi:hypothetical protein
MLARKLKESIEINTCDNLKTKKHICHVLFVVFFISILEAGIEWKEPSMKIITLSYHV